MKRKELLFEIGCEELPAGWLPGLTRQIGEHVATRLAEARLDAAGPTSFSTPRRLAVVVPGVAERQDDLEELVTGPPLSAALKDGQPTPAGLGFARKHDVAFADLEQVETPRGVYLAVRRRGRGRAAADVLPGVLAAAMRDLSFPKLMKWDAVLEDGKGELLFGRPIRWLLALFGGRVVPLVIRRSATADGVRDVASGRVTFGHRFLASSGRPGRAIRVKTFEDYRRRLAEHFVVLDRAGRRERIAGALDTRARGLGGRVLVPDGSTFLDEVPDLVEYPGVVSGAFDPSFLSLPSEVLTTTMIHHQHYFPVVDERGALKPAFLAVTNIEPADEAPIAVNAERVLTARLRDARFFWETDRKTPLASRLDRLDTVVFHKALGSYRAKAERIEVLAEWIAREAFGRPDQAGFARHAAWLAKTDLTTGMVGEFPELQGVMGGIYAREEGQPEGVWRAIYHHYLPVAVEADAPPAAGTLGAAGVSWGAVSLADKLDTIVALFSAGERPTGSRDPFGLRRQAHGALKVLVDLERLGGSGASPDLESLVDAAAAPFGGLPSWGAELASGLRAFLVERLEYLLQQRGFDVRNVRAVVRGRALAALRPAEALRKLDVLPEFTESPDFTKLAVAFKRVRNMARELPDAEFERAEREAPALGADLAEPAERDLAAELDARRPLVDAAVAGREYRRAFAEAAKFGPAVDRFFTEVFVMVDDARLRRARLRLIKRLERLILQIADISEIVPQTEP